jgi:acyl-CoA synthetase (AMP-forming)/AMP-acid ligase II
MRYRYLIERTVRLYGERSAVVCGTDVRTFADVYARACRLANALGARGCRAGDRVGVLLPNCAEYVEIDIALALAGLVRVSLNARAVPAQHRVVLEDAGAETVVRSPELVLEEVGLRDVITLGDDYDRLLRDAPETPPGADPAPEDLYCLFYTSGTTGSPKGVMLTHRAFFAVAFNLLIEFGPVRAGERILLPQPLSHGAGFFLPAWLMSGGTAVVMPQYEPGLMLELAESHGVETIKVVPTMLLQLLASGLGERGDLPQLRQVIYGASPMPVQPLEELLASFGPVFTQLYGQAEAPMCITVLPREDHVDGDRRLLASAGRPYRGVEVRVVDDEGRDADRGEVVVRGEHLMSGYWEKPELTAQVLRDGWVHTRDLAEVDKRGYLYLLGRTDDMIISGGFNIAPRAIEDVLARHPAVLESAVIGVPHDTLGEEVTAFVSLRPGQAATEDEIIEYTREELGFQKPRRVTILDRIPRNAYGKVAKQELERLGGGGAP